MHSETKFDQNRSDGCTDIAFNVFFQNGGRLPSWIFTISFAIAGGPRDELVSRNPATTRHLI